MASTAAGMGSHADMFLKIDGIEGESTDSKHKNEIELQSFSWGATQPGSAGHGGGAGVGKVQVHDFSFSISSTRLARSFLNIALPENTRQKWS